MPIVNSKSGEIVIYSLAGFRIVSDLPLRGLTRWDRDFQAADEIAIRRASIPESLSRVDAVFPGGQYNNNELLLDIPNVARYLLRDGNEILVDQANASSHEDVCSFLLGTVFGLLSHRRGIIPLHASAIDIADGCVAFMGESGSGKSTLTAALVARGHYVIADDVCFLQPNTRFVHAWPGVNRIRLWEDAIAALGCKSPGLERIWNGWNKFFIPGDPPQNPLESRQLHRIYQLQTASVHSLPSLERLRGAEAIDVVLQNVYRLDLAERIGLKPAVFRLCARIAKDVSVFRFSRPKDLRFLREGVDFLEDHLHNIH